MIKAGAYFLNETLTNIPSGTFSFYGNLKVGGTVIGDTDDKGRVRMTSTTVEISETSDSTQISSAFATIYSGGWSAPTEKSWVFVTDYDTTTNGYSVEFELWFVENIASSLVIEITDVDGVKLLTKDRVVYHDIIVSPKLEEVSFTPDEEGKTITPTTGYAGVGKVVIAPIPDDYVIPSGQVNITANGVVNVKSFETASVNVALPKLFAPSVSLSEATLTITPTTENGSFVTNYEITVGGVSKVTTTEGAYNLALLGLGEGVYTIGARAVATNFTASDISNTVTYEVYVSYETEANDSGTTVVVGTYSTEENTNGTTVIMA